MRIETWEKIAEMLDKLKIKPYKIEVSDYSYPSIRVEFYFKEKESKNEK